MRLSFVVLVAMVTDEYAFSGTDGSTDISSGFEAIWNAS
jgi:hypothetical protein